MVTRIKQLLEWQQLSPTQFADRIGVGRPVVSHILSERNKPSLEVVQRIIAAFPELSLPWLLSGTGDMLAAPVGQAPAAFTAAGPAPVAPAAIAVATSPIAEPTAAPPPAAMSPAASELRPRPASFPAQRASATTARAQPPRFRPGRTEPVALALEADKANRLPAAAGAAAPAPAAGAAAPAAATPAASVPVAATAPELPAAPVGQEAAAGSGLVARSEAAPTATGSPGAATSAGPVAAGWLAGLSEPGKAIRRIVLFYRDGSFADYQPE